jgi:putative hydrolase of the HAD superfamily
MEPSSPLCLFFDLDDTLYPPQTGIWQEISQRINRYMIEKVGIPEAGVNAVRENYFRLHGTTLNGLRIEYGVNPRDYLETVHDIPLDRYLRPDPSLRSMLSRLSQKKYVFSNADEPYIRRVLTSLGIRDQFDGIIDIFSTGFACKPMETAYQIALQSAGSPPPAHCWLVDDLPRNLVQASRMGMTTVLVHKKAPIEAADFQIDTIYQLESLISRDVPSG